MDESEQAREPATRADDGQTMGPAGTDERSAEEPGSLRGLAATGGLLGASAAAGAGGATTGQGVGFALIPGAAPEEGKPGETVEDEG